MFRWTLLFYMLVFHMLGFVLWVGTLLIVTQLLIMHTEEASAEARGALGRAALRLLKRVAHPGAAVTVIAGLILIATNSQYYLRAAWLHAKLLLVAVLVASEVVLYVRTRRFAAGQIGLQRRAGMMMQAVIILLFLGIVALAVVKPI